MKHFGIATKIILIFAVLFFAARFISGVYTSNKILRQIASRLEADSRIAEALVTGVNFNEKTEKNETTIKFLEYGVDSKPLEPKYFTFSGNIIQFQSLVIRFDDRYVEKADRLKGKSIYLFWKVFMLDGLNTTEYEISKLNEVPEGYNVGKSAYERELWKKFWHYALSQKGRAASGVKSAQIEAPGTVFIPGILYTLKIEHDGGIRIDTSEIPKVLRGETIPE